MMERRFFGFLVHVAVVTFTAGRIFKSHDPATTRQEFGNGPIRLELRATNTNNRDLGILLETILDVKDFVRLVHVIAVNHRDGIDLSDARDGSKETRNRHWLLEDETDPEEIIQPNDDDVEEFKRRRKLVAIVSNVRRRPETLKLLTRHSKDVVRNVLMEILADLENHSRAKRRYEASFDRRRDAIIDEVDEVMKQIIGILRKRPGRRKKIIEEAPKLWEVVLPGRLTPFDADDDALSNLCAETKILQRLILENSALSDSRRIQEETPEEDEGPDDLNAAFRFFMDSSPHLRISEELQNSLNAVLDRIMRNYAKKMIRQGHADCEKQQLTNEDITIIRKLMDLEEESKVHRKDEEVKLLQSRTKEQNSTGNVGEFADGMSNFIQNGRSQSDQVLPSDSEGVSQNSNNSDNANVQELQIPIDSEGNSDDVPSKSKTTQDHEENTTTDVATTETLHNNSSEQENDTVDAEEKATTIISVTENNETSKIVEKIPGETDKYKEIDHPTELSVDTTVSDGNPSTTRDDSMDLPTDNILIALNEGKAEKNSTDLSMDGTTTEEDKNETINSRTDPPNETTVNEEKKENNQVKNKIHPPIGPIATEKNWTTAVNNKTDRSLETNMNKGIDEIPMNHAINISIDIIELKENDDIIENNRTSDPPSNPIATDGNQEKTNNTNDASTVTEEINKKTENQTTEFNSVEVGPTMIATSMNESSQQDVENAKDNLTESTKSKPTELPTESDDYEVGSLENQNINTNININKSHLRFPLHAGKNRTVSNVIEVPDIVTTMRFGSFDLYDEETDEKMNVSVAATSPDQKSKPIAPRRSDAEKSPGKEITRPPKEIDHPLGRELVPPSEEIISNATTVKVVPNDSQLVGNRKEDFVASVQTRRSLGPSPDIPRLPQVSKPQSGRNSTREDEKTERKKRKKNIMDIILETITSIVADNATHRAKPTDHKKPQRSC